MFIVLVLIQKSKFRQEERQLYDTRGWKFKFRQEERQLYDTRRW